MRSDPLTGGSGWKSRRGQTPSGFKGGLAGQRSDPEPFGVREGVKLERLSIRCLGGKPLPGFPPRSAPPSASGGLRVGHSPGFRSGRRPRFSSLRSAPGGEKSLLPPHTPGLPKRRTTAAAQPLSWPGHRFSRGCQAPLKVLFQKAIGIVGGAPLARHSPRQKLQGSFPGGEGTSTFSTPPTCPLFQRKR